MRIFKREINIKTLGKVINLVLRIPKILHRKLIVRDHRFLIIRKIEKNIVKKWLNPSPKEKILDMACGMGSWSEMITINKAKYFGVDINEIDIKKAKQRYPKSTFRVGGAEERIFLENSFDKIFSNCSIEHFDDDLLALKNFNYYLKNNGLLVLTTDSLSRDGFSKNLIQKHRHDYYVNNYYTYETLSKKLINSGFDIIDYRYYLTSKISDYFYSLGIKYGMNSWILYLFPIAYPLTIISDFLYGYKKNGCCLAILAKKRDVEK